MTSSRPHTTLHCTLHDVTCSLYSILGRYYNLHSLSWRQLTLSWHSLHIITNEILHNDVVIPSVVHSDIITTSHNSMLHSYYMPWHHHNLYTCQGHDHTLNIYFMISLQHNAALYISWRYTIITFIDIVTTYTLHNDIISHGSALYPLCYTHMLRPKLHTIHPKRYSKVELVCPIS